MLQDKLVWKEEGVSVSYQGRCDSILSEARAEVWLHRVHSTWFNMMPYLHVVWVWWQGMFGLLFRCYVIVELKSNSVRNSSIGIVGSRHRVSFGDNLRFDGGARAYRFFDCHVEEDFWREGYPDAVDHTDEATMSSVQAMQWVRKGKKLVGFFFDTFFVAGLLYIGSSSCVWLDAALECLEWGCDSLLRRGFSWHPKDFTSLYGEANGIGSC